MHCVPIELVICICVAFHEECLKMTGGRTLYITEHITFVMSSALKGVQGVCVADLVPFADRQI
jgi:hypothetical protein